MKIIILAAGKGTRLLPLTKNTPKPLIYLDEGITILEKQIENIQRSGVIDEIILVTGYLSEQIETKIELYKKQGFNIKIVYNPFYNHSNNLISLWLARYEMNDDFLITNGDNIFSSNVFRELIEKTSEGIFLAINKKDNTKYIDGDMKVTLTPNNTISKVSKQIEKEKVHAESPGLVKISGERYRKIYSNMLEKLVKKDESINQFWLETFNQLYEDGFSINSFEINGEKDWHEIDFHLDLNKVRDLIFNKNSYKEEKL